MTKRILVLLALAAVLTPMLLADATTPTPPSPPTTAQVVSNMVDQLTKLLDLTTAQQTQATTIFTTQQTALASLKTSMQTAQTALDTAVTKNDSLVIASSASTIGSLTTQQVTAQATGDAAFWQILTSDQQTKLGVLHAAGLGGPGGPGQGGGPGGPGQGGGQGGPGGPPPPPPGH